MNRFYRTTYINEVYVSDVEGVIQTFVPEPGILYVICKGEGKTGWVEITQADFEAAGGTLPTEEPTT